MIYERTQKKSVHIGTCRKEMAHQNLSGREKKARLVVCLTNRVRLQWKKKTKTKRAFRDLVSNRNSKRYCLNDQRSWAGIIAKWVSLHILLWFLDRWRTKTIGLWIFYDRFYNKFHANRLARVYSDIHGVYAFARAHAKHTHTRVNIKWSRVRASENIEINLALFSSNIHFHVEKIASCVCSKAWVSRRNRTYLVCAECRCHCTLFSRFEYNDWM